MQDYIYKFKNHSGMSLIDNCFDKSRDGINDSVTVDGLMNDNRGIGVVEVVLILVVLVALVIIFKDKIIEIINNLFSSISSDVDTI